MSRDRIGSPPPADLPRGWSGAIGAFVRGISRRVCGCSPLGIVGAIPVLRANDESRRDSHSNGGRGMALAGICLSPGNFSSLRF